MSSLNSLRACHCCGLVQRLNDVPPRHVASCCRCRTRIPILSGDSPRNAAAGSIALTALILFIPAITLPFLRIERLGHSHESSLLGGVASLLAGGHWLVGLIVLAFSVVLPPIKLFLLLILSQAAGVLRYHHRASTYRAIEHLGRWGMLDVLFVAVVIAFVKLGDLVEFGAGPGLPAFASFVLLSLCASVVFNPHCLWEARPVSEPGASNPPATTSSAAPSSAASSAATPSATGATSATPPDVPAATVAPRRRWWWLWLLPALVLAIVGWTLRDSWKERGVAITVTFRDGHGLRPGDDLRHQGIAVGKVESVVLTPDLQTVQVSVRVMPEAERLAREGTRFWIVRPQLDLTGFAGLETVIGAKYLEVLPGPADGPKARRFVGMEDPPLPDAQFPGGLEIVLQATEAAGLRAGLPVTYRQLRIGGVQRVQLASDGSAVEARVYVRPEFRHLIRGEARFWMVGGVRVTGGLSGFSLQVGALESLLRAGIALSLPTDPGPAVGEGHRFTLHDRPDPEWLQWRPRLEDGSLPPDLPRLARATASWKEKGLVWTSARQRSGWVLPTPDGLLGPRDLLAAPTAAAAGSARLEVNGQPIESGGELSDAGPGLAARAGPISEPPNQAFPLRAAAIPEDGYLTAGAGENGLPDVVFLAAARIKTGKEAWLVDADFPLDPRWHGAVLVARDGAAIGILLHDGRHARIAPLAGPATAR